MQHFCQFLLFWSPNKVFIKWFGACQETFCYQICHLDVSPLQEYQMENIFPVTWLLRPLQYQNIRWGKHWLGSWDLWKQMITVCKEARTLYSASLPAEPRPSASCLALPQVENICTTVPQLWHISKRKYICYFNQEQYTAVQQRKMIVVIIFNRKYHNTIKGPIKTLIPKLRIIPPNVGTFSTCAKLEKMTKRRRKSKNQ